MKKVSNFFCNLLKQYKYKSINILSIILTLLTIFGTSYMKYETGNLVFKDIFHLLISIFVGIILFFVFKILISLIYKLFDNKYNDSKPKSKLFKMFEKHPFLFSFIFVIICYIPYVIVYYPAIVAPDPVYQIEQFLGIENGYANSSYSVFYDSSITTITDHHPVVHTLILGNLVKFGLKIGNINFGLFIYSFLQVLLMAYVFSKILKYMKEKSLPYIFRKMMLFIFALTPMFPLYAMNPVKDVIFTLFMILYILFIIKLIENKDTKLNTKDFIYLLFILLCLLLFRHNGLHIIILSLPFLIIFSKRNRILLSVSLVFILGFNYTFNNVILPHYHIAPSSMREKLSIPFQQTARYVKYYENDLTKEEYSAINNILEINDLGTRYKSNISDPVKEKFNIYAEINDFYIKDYFKSWYSCFKKHPTVYVDATINNVYGYFYPFKTNWYVYYKAEYNNQGSLQKDGYDYHFNSLDGIRNVLSNYGKNYQHIPVVGWICNIGLNTWLLFIMSGYLISTKKKEGLIVLLPSLVSVLVCVASPVNCYYRYAMPYIFANGLVLAFVMSYKKGSNRNEK